MYDLKGCCSQVIFREVFCHEYGKIPRHTGQNPITEGDMEWILTKLLWTEWTVTLKVKNVYGQSHLCPDSFISASGGSSYLSFLTNPSIVAPSRIFLNTKATIVFMYFSLLSGKIPCTQYFRFHQNIVSSTSLSLLTYTCTTGASDSISRINMKITQKDVLR